MPSHEDMRLAMPTSLSVHGVGLHTSSHIFKSDNPTDHNSANQQSPSSPIHQCFQSDEYINQHSSAFISPSPLEWSNPHTVHLVYTRFMQDQSHLSTLAQARLLLFETFCLPTLQHQTNQDFIWIIQTDPKLDEKILKRIIELFQPHENFYLVGHQANYLIDANQQLHPWDGDITSCHTLKNINANMFYTGNLRLLQAAIQASSDRIILETRLDADDGLHTSYVEYLQNKAMSKYEETPTLNWFFWCISHHIEWLFDPNLPSKEYIRSRTMNKFCITPGLTSSARNRKLYETCPIIGHHKVYQQLKPNGDQCGLGKHDSCIKVVTGKGLSHAAVRARTPTSAGMKDVHPVKNPNMEESTMLWDNVLTSSAYHLDKDQVQETIHFFQENLGAIAKENLEGQCTKGHSCKHSSKELLKKLVDKHGN